MCFFDILKGESNFKAQIKNPGRREEKMITGQWSQEISKIIMLLPLFVYFWV